MVKTIDKKSIKQIIRFSIVGVFNTFVDYGLFYVFLAVVNLHKSIAQVVATSAAMCASYLINRHWTFGRDGRGNIGEIAKFLTVNIISMLTTIFFTHIFYDIWHIENIFNELLNKAGVSYVLMGDVAVMVSKVCASVFSLTINFLGNKLWVFKSNTAE